MEALYALVLADGGLVSIDRSEVSTEPIPMKKATDLFKVCDWCLSLAWRRAR